MIFLISTKISHFQTSIKTSVQDSLLIKVNKIVDALQLTSEDKINFREAILYVYNKLEAMLGYDYSNIKLKGPITVFKTGQKFTDSTLLKVRTYLNYKINISSLINNFFQNVRCVIKLQYVT